MQARMSQLYDLTNLESAAFRHLKNNNVKFPYAIIKLVKNTKKVALCLKKGSTVIATYKSVSTIEKNLINDINKAINS